MASLRQIRRRIRSIQNTQQTMRAMQLVSGSKFKRAYARLLQIRAVAESLTSLWTHLQAQGVVMRQPLCETRDPSRALGLVVITSDTGLCGAYNANLLHLAEAHLKADGKVPTRLILIGKKGSRYLTKRGYQSHTAYLDLAGRPNLEKAGEIARTLMGQFLSGAFDAIHVAYTRFVSPMVYRPAIDPWLPIPAHPVTPGPPLSPTAGAGQSPSHPVTEIEYIFEPTPQRVFEALLPWLAVATFQRMVLEAFTAEHSARMIAMKNATDNTEELLSELTLRRNKIRQALITKELSEIVGTVEALK